MDRPDRMLRRRKRLPLGHSCHVRVTRYGKVSLSRTPIIRFLSSKSIRQYVYESDQTSYHQETQYKCVVNLSIFL
jgi:hypothetical protein